MLNEQKKARVRGLCFGGMLGAMAMLCGLGCTLASQPPLAEPGSILLKNMTGGDLSWIVVAEARKKTGQPVRLGRFAPVPAGSTQGIGRPTDAPALPPWVEVHWVDAHGQQHGVEVSLAEILKKAMGVPEEALVFRLFPRGHVDVVLEYEKPWNRRITD